jgi:hypothetical protein
VARVVELEDLGHATVARFEILAGHIEDYAVFVTRHKVTA